MADGGTPCTNTEKLADAEINAAEIFRLFR